MKKNTFLFFAIILMFSACTNNNKRNIDTSQINVNVEIKRLDKDIFEINLGNPTDDINNLINKYGEFFELYNAKIVHLGNPYSKTYPDVLNGFITDFTMNEVYNKTMEVFPNLNSLENELEDAFKRYKYFFPDRNIPEIYSFIGGFNQSMVVSDSILGIGLDKYLGSDCVFYDRLGISNYLQQNMTPEMIPIDAVKAWALSEFVFNDSVDNVINNIIYHGKIQYFIDVMFPEKADSLKCGFTEQELQWCTNNEKQMWDYLIDQKLLFSTDYMLINKFVNPAPFTSGFPNESPGRATVWLGWQIVNIYMKRHSDVSFSDLMLENNYQKILTGSHYKP